MTRPEDDLVTAADAIVTDVVVVPGAPLLLPEYQGRHPAAPGLLEACVAAVRSAVATASHVVVVHATDREPRSTRPPIGLRVADHLLAASHLGFEVEHRAVVWDAPTQDCIVLGHDIAAVAAALVSNDRSPRGHATAPHGAADAPALGHADGRTTLLVVADGSARRTEKAPGHLDPRAAGVDDAIVAALRDSADGGLDRLLALDPHLCADLLVAGRAPLQVLAAAATATSSRPTARNGVPVPFEVQSCEVSDPFGVLYVVAHLTRTVPTPLAEPVD